MFRRLRTHVTYANVASTLALIGVLATGTAYAANTIFSSDIVDGQVKAPDIDAGAVLSAEIANGQVRAADIGDGEVKAAEIAAAAVTNAELAPGAVKSGNVQDDNLTGGDIANNTLKGTDVDEGTLDIGDSARAYAVVSPGSCASDGCTPTQKKNVASVTQEGTGTYCVFAPGIDADESPAVAGVDWSGTNAPEGDASAMTLEGDGCGPGDNGFYVLTFRHPVVVVDQSGGQAQVVGSAQPSGTVGFTVVIP